MHVSLKTDRQNEVCEQWQLLLILINPVFQPCNTLPIKCCFIWTQSYICCINIAVSNHNKTSTKSVYSYLKSYWSKSEKCSPSTIWQFAGWYEWHQACKNLLQSSKMVFFWRTWSTVTNLVQDFTAVTLSMKLTFSMENAQPYVISTLILGSVFSNYVMFYGDTTINVLHF